ncbi:MAG: SEL1-like repeat protein [Candidatus Saccharibacteria bacterium]|nr:SEL1-like repeat protein [Rhodoferax sp.]
MRTQAFILSFIAGVVCALAQPSMAASESTKLVVQAIEARDCVAAARELNVALAGATPEALALAGVMFETGLCLKPNLERAARFYTKAVDAGAPGARSRLAGLYASPASGPDKGAALWWSMQANLPLPKACLVESSLRGNAEQFAKALTAWPAGVLDACVYVAGIVAALDAEFVIKEAAQGRTSVSIDFRPATSALDVRNSQSSLALVDDSPRTATNSNAGNLFANNSVKQSATPEQMLALRAQDERQALIKRVEAVSKDALARYPRPSGIDADWRIQLSVEGLRDR